MAEADDIDLEFDLDNEQSKPEPLWLVDGEIVILDPEAFAEATGSIAFQARDGALYLLKRDSMKWINIEDEPKTKRPRSLTAVKT